MRIYLAKTLCGQFHYKSWFLAKISTNNYTKPTHLIKTVLVVMFLDDLEGL